MIGGRKDYSVLLEKCGDLLHEYGIDTDGVVYNRSTEQEERNDRIIANIKFFVKYLKAFQQFDEARLEERVRIDIHFIERVINCHGVFNNLINTMVGEYQVYDNINTGNVTYAPYQSFADFFFNDDGNKEVLIDFLNTELNNIFQIKKNQGRVK